MCLGLGSISWAAGQGYWSWSALSGRDDLPFPSFADVGYLFSLPLFAAGVVAWPRRRRLRRSDLLDGLIGLAVATFVVFEFAVEPILLEWEGTATNWVALAYPLGDYLVVAPLVLGLLLNLFADRARALVVAVGLGLLTSADTMFSVALGEGRWWTGVVDPAWALAFVAIGSAVLLPQKVLQGRLRRVPFAAFVAVLTGVFTCVTLADAVESPAEAAVGGIASYFLALMVVVGAWRVLSLARERERDSRELRKTQDELRRAQLARDRFLVDLVNAQEEDARKVADVLHDDVVQQLTALGFRLELAALQHEVAKLREFATDTSLITKSIRLLLTQLHPAILESQGLAPAIEVAAEPLRERGTEIRVSPFPHRLIREVEVLAYRVVLEALAFVADPRGRHHVVVELSVRDGALRCRVAQPGWSAPLEHGADSLGLFVARERIELAGGRFLISSDLVDGTVVTFDLPLLHEPAAEKAAS